MILPDLEDTETCKFGLDFRARQKIFSTYFHSLLSEICKFLYPRDLVRKNEYLKSGDG